MFSLFFHFCFSFVDIPLFLFFFFFNDTATTEIYTLSLHDALPISAAAWPRRRRRKTERQRLDPDRSEEHTSELQSPLNLVCRLLLEKKKKVWVCYTFNNMMNCSKQTKQLTKKI